MNDTKQLVILSGKGGTGKTSVTAALAHLASQSIPLSLADADVDASNLELVLSPNVLEEHAFSGGDIAHIDTDMCIACGVCAEHCRFDAIHPGETYQVDPAACEGCAACMYRCPHHAITMQSTQTGTWYASETTYGPLTHAELFAGAENSGKLVTLVKQQARLRALDDERPLVLIDGPPGIGCPVISAASGATLALMVIEPTPSGVHDLERVISTTDHFGVPAAVVINKADLSDKRADDIEAYCQAHTIPILARLPYDTIITEAMVHGQPVTAYSDAPISQQLKALWDAVKLKLDL